MYLSWPFCNPNTPYLNLFILICDLKIQLNGKKDIFQFTAKFQCEIWTYWSLRVWRNCQKKIFYKDIWSNKRKSKKRIFRKMTSFKMPSTYRKNEALHVCLKWCFFQIYYLLCCGLQIRFVYSNLTGNFFIAVK